MDKIDELKSKIRENSLVISRVPKNTKEKFIAFANEEFAGDYGMILKVMTDDYILFKKIKESFVNNKLKIIFENEKKM